MTFDQIQYFIAIAECNTYFDAAEELNISQSALSKQIIKLEKELGVTLLDRSRRKASLTPAGETFYQDALALRRQYEIMTGHMKKYKIPMGNKNELRIGTLPILTQYGLTAHFRQFTESHPDIHLILDEVEENDLKKGLLSSQYDLIICREQMIADQSDISSVYLADDELVTVLPVGRTRITFRSCRRVIHPDEPLHLRLSDLSGIVRKCAGPPTDFKNRTCRIDHQRRCHRGGRKPPSIQ